MSGQTVARCLPVRPLRRLIQTTIEDQLARRALGGEVLEGDTVTFDLDPEGNAVRVVSDVPVAV